MTHVGRIIRMAAALAVFGAPVTAQTADNAAPVSRDVALRAFAKLKTVLGEWEGRSTAGWEGTARLTEIARGSVLISQSTFSAHPADNEGMVTVYYMDAGSLMLTHYCVARNAPRLQLTAATDDLTTLTFTFVDGANLPSRDTGHMDKVVFTFAGPDRYTSRWTWYEKGQERWLEEIVHTRKP